MINSWRKEMLPDVINLVLGAMLLVSPWAFGFASDTAAAWNAGLSGLLIVGLALAAIAVFDDREEWLSLAAGAWVAVSPWLVGFSGNATAMWLHLIAGVIVAVMAAVRLWLEHNRNPRVSA